MIISGNVRSLTLAVKKEGGIYEQDIKTNIRRKRLVCSVEMSLLNLRVMA